MSAEEHVEEATQSIKGGLSHKIGPLPAGVWVAIVVGALGIAYWTRTHASASATPVATDTTAPTVGNLGSYATDADSSASDTLTQDGWAKKAITYLISQGAAPTVADGAVRSYLEGDQLDAAQTALIDLALAAVGSPPTLPPLPLTGLVGTTAGVSSGGTATVTVPVVDSHPVTSAPQVSTPATVTTNYGPGSLYSVLVGGRTVALSTTDVTAINDGKSVAGLSGSDLAAAKAALHAKGLA